MGLTGQRLTKDGGLKPAEVGRRHRKQAAVDKVGKFMVEVEVEAEVDPMKKQVENPNRQHGICRVERGNPLKEEEESKQRFGFSVLIKKENEIHPQFSFPSQFFLVTQSVELLGARNLRFLKVI
ncbi:hypothetical protein V6N11_004355 [Hibiscus sabdariffa]|uniref:Uncharacterized protein n=1 Tax=Hibiscus sabdariffa TaxID=183260 RepID=A0ABR2SG73_9ROSI